MEIRICIDVDDIERAVAFYTQGLGLKIGRRFDDLWVEIVGATSPIDLLANPPGSVAIASSGARRDFSRHWTPVHLDFVVADLDAAVARAVGAGARLERGPSIKPYGRIALLADPFGHGIDFLEMNARGYDALLQAQ